MPLVSGNTPPIMQDRTKKYESLVSQSAHYKSGNLRPTMQDRTKELKFLVSQFAHYGNRRPHRHLKHRSNLRLLASGELNKADKVFHEDVKLGIKTFENEVHRTYALGKLKEAHTTSHEEVKLGMKNLEIDIHHTNPFGKFNEVDRTFHEEVKVVIENLGNEFSIYTGDLLDTQRYLESCLC